MTCSRHVDGFEEDHGRYGVGDSDVEVRILLELSGETIVCQIHGLGEWKKGRRHLDREKMRQKLTLCW